MQRSGSNTGTFECFLSFPRESHLFLGNHMMSPVFTGLDMWEKLRWGMFNTSLGYEGKTMVGEI